MNVEVYLVLTGTSHQEGTKLRLNLPDGRASLFELFRHLNEELSLSAVGHFAKEILTQRRIPSPYIVLIDGRVLNDLDETSLSDGSQVLVIPLLEGG